MYEPFGGKPESMTVWFSATSNQGVVASVEFVLNEVSKLIRKVVRRYEQRGRSP